jgi:hypothetical protein
MLDHRLERHGDPRRTEAAGSDGRLRVLVVDRRYFTLRR